MRRTCRRCRRGDDRCGCHAVVVDGHGDARADRRAVALDTVSLSDDPVVAVTRVLEHAHRVTVARRRATDLGDDVLVAVVVEVDEGNPVPLVDFAGAGRLGDVDERLPPRLRSSTWGASDRVRTACPCRDRCRGSRRCRVAEVGTHRHEHLVESDRRRHILEGAVALVAIQLQRRRVARQVEIGAGGVVDRHVVAGRVEIEPAVVVVVEEPGGEAAAGPRHAGGNRAFGEGACRGCCDRAGCRRRSWRRRGRCQPSLS